jgi:hypothetical protein
MFVAVKDRRGRAGSDYQAYHPHDCGICSVTLRMHGSSGNLISCQPCRFFAYHVLLCWKLTIIQHMKDHLILFFVLLTGKLYLIGMLYTLNSRVMLRERMRSHDFGRTSLGTWQWDQESRTTRTFGSVSEVMNSLSCSSGAQFHFVSLLNRLIFLQPCVLLGQLSHGPAVEPHRFTQTSRLMTPATAFRLSQHATERRRIPFVRMHGRLVFPCAVLFNLLALNSHLESGFPSQYSNKKIRYLMHMIQARGKVHDILLQCRIWCANLFNKSVRRSASLLAKVTFLSIVRASVKAGKVVAPYPVQYRQ